jgi:hypothetical protein
MRYPKLSLAITLFVIHFLTGCERDSAPQTSGSEREESKESAHDELPSEKSNAELNQQKKRKSEDNKMEIRNPKQRYSEIVIPSRRPNLIGERLEKEFEGLDPKSEKFARHTVRLWKENLAKLANEPLKSAGNPLVKDGALLPKELESWKVSNGGEDTPENMILGLWLMVLLSGDDVITDLIGQRADELPPTETDLVVFKSMSIAVNEIGNGKNVSQFEQWKPFSNANNPLFRLLALRAAIRSTAQAASSLSSEDPTYNRINGTAKLDFYLSFLDEKDPTILTEAVSAVATVPTPEARQAIEKFKVAQQQCGNVSLVETAIVALRTQELIAKSSR